MRMVKTSGRSSSAIAARRPSPMAASNAARASARSRKTASMTRPPAFHPQSSDRGPVRQREDIGRLERNVEGVAESLREFHPGEGPGDAGPDIDAVQGQVSSRRDECAEAAVRLCLAVIWPCLWPPCDAWVHVGFLSATSGPAGFWAATGA